MRVAGVAARVCLGLSLAAGVAQAHTTSHDPILRCSATDLGIHYVNTQGATGRIAAEFSFINVTHHKCRLFGYPGASAFTASGARIRLHVARDALRPDHPVVLASQHSARFLFQTWDRAGGGPCRTSAILRFIPPGDRAYEQIRHRQLMCRGLATVTAVGVT
jgi:Protein of unknown function (DUF4232)